YCSGRSISGSSSDPPVFLAESPAACQYSSDAKLAACALAGCLGIGLEFGCNVLVRQWTFCTNTVLFGNGAYSLCGMAAGYKGWGQALIDHPELEGAQGAQPIYTIAGHAFAMIRSTASVHRGCSSFLSRFFCSSVRFCKTEFHLLRT